MKTAECEASRPPSGLSGPGVRIVIHGVTGSGKSTLARRLAHSLGLGLIELDALRHARGWDSVDWPEMRGVLSSRIGALPQGWVCEGNYSRVADIVLKEADTVIWLRLPWLISFARVLRRTVHRGWRRERLYTEQGPRESLVQAFASRDSILWWAVHHHRATNRSIAKRVAALPSTTRRFDLRSTTEIERFAQNAERTAQKRLGFQERT